MYWERSTKVGYKKYQICKSTKYVNGSKKKSKKCQNSKKINDAKKYQKCKKMTKIVEKMKSEKNTNT